MTQHRIAWYQNSSLWKMMPVTNAAVVRLVALSGSEREISHQECQVYVFQPDRCRQLLQVGEYGLVRASTKHLGAVAKACGCRFRSWRNSHDSGLVDKPSFDRVRWVKSKGFLHNSRWQQTVQRRTENLMFCTLDGQQRRSMTKGSGITESNGKEREQVFFLIQIAVGKTRPTSRTSEPV